MHRIRVRELAFGDFPPHALLLNLGIVSLLLCDKLCKVRPLEGARRLEWGELGAIALVQKDVSCCLQLLLGFLGRQDLDLGQGEYVLDRAFGILRRVVLVEAELSLWPVLHACLHL